MRPPPSPILYKILIKDFFIFLARTHGRSQQFRCFFEKKKLLPGDKSAIVHLDCVDPRVLLPELRSFAADTEVDLKYERRLNASIRRG